MAKSRSYARFPLDHMPTELGAILWPVSRQRVPMSLVSYDYPQHIANIDPIHGAIPTKGFFLFKEKPMVQPQPGRAERFHALGGPMGLCVSYPAATTVEFSGRQNSKYIIGASEWSGR